MYAVFTVWLWMWGISYFMDPLWPRHYQHNGGKHENTLFRSPLVLISDRLNPANRLVSAVTPAVPLSEPWDDALHIMAYLCGWYPDERTGMYRPVFLKKILARLFWADSITQTHSCSSDRIIPDIWIKVIPLQIIHSCCIKICRSEK